MPACRELGIGFVAFSPVARGFLSGAIRSADYLPGDLRLTMPRFIAPHFERNRETMRRFEALAAGVGITPARVALGWVLARGAAIVPIPGTRSLAHLEENLAATPLDAGTTAAVDALFASGAISGPRYGPAAQATIDTERLPEEE